MREVEIRVRPVTRYVVTRYETYHEDAGDNGKASSGGSCQTIGEFHNEHMAEYVAKTIRGEEERAAQIEMRD